MLELRDRYSYFHMMLPLLLTGYTDEIEEIRETTDSLWWDVGLKYEKENEEDLKDQINFPNTPNKYPPNCKYIFNQTNHIFFIFFVFF